MKEFSSDEIIRGIRYRNNNVFKYLYKSTYPPVLIYIKNNNGTDEDAKDVFQESLIILYRTACKPGFKLTSSVKTYIFSICKNIWYNKNSLKNVRNKSLSINIEDLVEEEELTYSQNEAIISENEIMESLKISLLQKYFRKLDRFCQRLLQWFYKGVSHAIISQRLKITNEMSRTRKKECMKKLINLVQKDPEFKKFYNNV